MEHETQYIATVDIGTTKIVCIVGKVVEEQGNKKVDVISYSIVPSRGIKHGTVSDIGKASNAIREATVKAELDKFNIREIFIGISGTSLKTILSTQEVDIESQVITEEHMERLQQKAINSVKQEKDTVVHIIPHNYLLDDIYSHENPIGKNAQTLKGIFTIVLADNALVNAIKTTVKDAGYNVSGLIFEPLASAEAVLYPDELSTGVVIVDIGGGTTDVSFYYENKFYGSYIIPYGGKSITRDISKALSITEQQAEQIKIEYGWAFPDPKIEEKIIRVEGIAGREGVEISNKTLARIIQARLTEIIDTVGSYIDDFEATYNINFPAGITFTGGGALIGGLKTFVKYRINKSARIGIPNLANVEELNKPQYATSLGLQLLAHHKTKINKRSTTKQKLTGKNLIQNIKKLFREIVSDPESE